MSVLPTLGLAARSRNLLPERGRPVHHDNVHNSPTSAGLQRIPTVLAKASGNGGRKVAPLRRTR